MLGDAPEGGLVIDRVKTKHIVDTSWHGMQTQIESF
jgi:hypothetical protein